MKRKTRSSLGSHRLRDAVPFICLALVAAALLAFSHRQKARVRNDLAVAVVLDNSASRDSIDPGETADGIRLAIAFLDAISKRYGICEAVMERFGSTPVDIYAEPYSRADVMTCLREHYLNIHPDPQPGSMLAPALKAVLQQTSAPVVVITVMTSSIDDAADVVSTVQIARSKGRRVILFFPNVVIHDPLIAKKQMNLRQDIRIQLAALGDDRSVKGKAEFQDEVDRWLPVRLTSAGVRRVE